MMVPGCVRLMKQEKMEKGKSFKQGTKVASNSTLKEKETKEPYGRVSVSLKIKGWKNFKILNSTYL